MVVDVASLGLFILDTFEWRTVTADGTATTTKRDEGIVGGGGTYAIMGSRTWLPPNRVGILVDRGYDWPKDLDEELAAYGSEMWVFREQPDHPTTRALNLYTGEHREFKYLSHRTRLEPKDLPPPLRTAQYLHFVCSPTRALEIQAQLRPEDNSTPQWQPRLVYEPIPDRCRPDELDALRLVLPSIAVFSPNHEEAWAFFGVSAAEANRRGRPGVEEVARKFLEEGAADLVVIRSGPMGAYALRRSGGAEEDAAAAAFWVPAYHSYETGKSTGKVVDVTGAGNSFLGGLMAGLVLYPDDLPTAVRCGAVSASFVIEQFALPKLTRDADGTERWNGVKPADRLAELAARGAH
ncbi:hypothetical protein JCM8115_000317 [Rhodotorula mucilaginosa]|uniref:Carbohydrate kinase PfkB domain-containing protein n=1 Tax=Rhodotorula mucilaginosa TaxID=5537 RepID=A0A9P7B6E9_RHOMI|nr:hypothetical protein C6P46_003255 [Rhodotorula mucilaginosa]